MNDCMSKSSRESQFVKGKRAVWRSAGKFLINQNADSIASSIFYHVHVPTSNCVRQTSMHSVHVGFELDGRREKNLRKSCWCWLNTAKRYHTRTVELFMPRECNLLCFPFYLASKSKCDSGWGEAYWLKIQVCIFAGSRDSSSWRSLIFHATRDKSKYMRSALACVHVLLSR